MFSLQTIFVLALAALVLASGYTRKARHLMPIVIGLAFGYMILVPNPRIQYIADYSTYPSVECKDEPCRELEERLSSVNEDTLKLQENLESLDRDNRFFMAVVAMFFFWATYRGPMPKGHEDDIQTLGLSK